MPSLTQRYNGRHYEICKPLVVYRFFLYGVISLPDATSFDKISKVQTCTKVMNVQEAHYMLFIVLFIDLLFLIFSHVLNVKIGDRMFVAVCKSGFC